MNPSASRLRRCVVVPDNRKEWSIQNVAVEQVNQLLRFVLRIVGVVMVATKAQALKPSLFPAFNKHGNEPNPTSDGQLIGETHVVIKHGRIGRQRRKVPNEQIRPYVGRSPLARASRAKLFLEFWRYLLASAPPRCAYNFEETPTRGQPLADGRPLHELSEPIHVLSE